MEHDHTYDEQLGIHVLAAAGELKIKEGAEGVEGAENQLIAGMVHVGTTAATKSITNGNIIKKVTIYGATLNTISDGFLFQMDLDLIQHTATLTKSLDTLPVNEVLSRILSKLLS